MSQLKPLQEFTIGLLLIGLMIATRFHHFGSVTHLPDASWAIFLTAGFFLRRWVFFLVFMGTAVLIDYLAITRFGVSSFCISSAYGFLLPAYASLWLGGQWLRTHYQRDWMMLLRLAAVVVISVAAAFLISNGSFFLLSGDFGKLSIAGFISQAMHYFPHFLVATAGYISVFTIVLLTVEMMLQEHSRDKHSTHRHA